MQIREPAVAGRFYPDDPSLLAETVAAYVSEAGNIAGPVPKAIIGPHAGYAYSGPVAGYAYAAVAPARDRIERVILLGPAHRVALDGLAVPGVDAFATPLGIVEIDPAARAAALGCRGVVRSDTPHAAEHSLEVHLPFLQQALGAGVRVLPVAVGRPVTADVASLLAALWGGAETLIVVSSDLSHYESYVDAREHDRRTAAAIERRAGEAIGPRDACGAFALRGLLAAAVTRDLDVRLLDLQSSGDTAGPRDRVVGYGAFALSARESGHR